MGFRTFSDYQKGFSHKKNATDCEDYADSYNDPEGRFHICAACDGHSDNNCFRSAKGAKFGCEAAIEILTRFFELYYEEGTHKHKLSSEDELRLKKSIKQCWDDKVFADLKEFPITEEEKAPLSDRVRSVYESDRGLQNIYGATFLAVAACEDFYLALHIGDGVMMCVDADGTYYEPLPPDEKSEMGSPASLCDTDLFSRDRAFRCKVSSQIPQVAIVSSDGIGDCMDKLQFMECIYSLISKFEAMEQVAQESSQLNDLQKSYLESCVKYYTEKGNGVEDDCSLAGIYETDCKIPQVKIPLEQANKLWEDAVRERNEVLKDYEKRKKETKEAMDNIRYNLRNDVNLLNDTEAWMDGKKKIEELKGILGNIEHNEHEKLAYFDGRLRICEEYIRRAGGNPPGTSHIYDVSDVDKSYIEEDLKFKTLLDAYEDAEKKQSKKQEAKREQEDAVRNCIEAKVRVTQAMDSVEKDEAEHEVKTWRTISVEKTEKSEEEKETEKNFTTYLKSLWGKATEEEGTKKWTF